MSGKQVLLVYGNPADGFTYIGPVTPNDPELDAFIEDHLSGETWWYVPVKSLASAISEEQDDEDQDDEDDEDEDDEDQDDEPGPELHSNEDGPDETYQVHIDEIRFAQWGPDCKGSNSYTGTVAQPDRAVCGRCQNDVPVSDGGYLFVHTSRRK